jgi:hypothetical protein
LATAFHFFGIDKFFYQTDQAKDEEKERKEKSDKNDASLTILNHCVCHLNRLELKLIIYK